MEWASIVERQLEEAFASGAFDNLAGKGQPLDLEGGLDATLRRILRDNGSTHPLLEARRALEDELEAARASYLRDRNRDRFEERLRALNRERRLFNLRTALPNFHLIPIDPHEELRRISLR